MTERLTSGLSPDALRALSTLTFDEQVDAPTIKKPRPSLKDIPFIEELDRNPELDAEIVTTMAKLRLMGLRVPVFHVTSRAVRFEDGTEQSTGYLENIEANGLRARDTNVAAFMRKGAVTEVADPEYFVENPHKFLRSMSESLRRYAHHGTRTNKQSLGDQREAGVGVPVMLVVDATNTPLSPGSDYDDHFKLGEQISADRIMGTVELDGRKSRDPDDLAATARDFLDVAAKYADEYHVAAA